MANDDYYEEEKMDEEQLFNMITKVVTVKVIPDEITNDFLDKLEALSRKRRPSRSEPIGLEVNLVPLQR